MLHALPSDTIPTRLELQRVATHVLARARFAADGRFGLRATPSGIGTPAFGPDGDVLRITGGLLVREFRTDRGARTSVVEIIGRSLADLADWAGVDLDAPFDAGREAPPVGDTSRVIDVSRAGCEAVCSWFGVAALAIDGILHLVTDPSVVQLWPEHFDLGLDVETPHGRVNLGGSPGDTGHPDPYLYVGPWADDRPGSASYWNAPFGAVLDHAALLASDDAVEAANSFFREGLHLLR